MTVKLTIPSLNKTVTLERGLKSPRKPTITPNDPEISRVLKEVEDHPEIVLSRREIIKYVLASPGVRAQQVQALLRFDSLDKVRAGLLKIANAAEREVNALTANLTATREHLLRALGISEMSRELLLTQVNRQRAILALAPIAELRDTTALNDGLETSSPNPKQRIAKAQATNDLAATRRSIAAMTSEEEEEKITSALAQIDALLLIRLSQVQRHVKIYSTGVSLIVMRAALFAIWNGIARRCVRASSRNLKSSKRLQRNARRLPQRSRRFSRT